MTCTGRVKVTQDDGRWFARCACGWGCRSWSWSRVWDCYTVCATGSYTPEDWIKDNGEPIGGAFINALEHVGLYDDVNAQWVGMTP